MASLVRMEDEGARQPGDRIELSEHLDDEGEVYRLREGPCDDLVRGGVFDRGKVASVFPVRPIIQVAYVRQQMLAVLVIINLWILGGRICRFPSVTYNLLKKGDNKCTGKTS